MTAYRLTPAARRDLSSIRDYSEAVWGSGQAETQVMEIRASIERLEQDPSRGRACDDVREVNRRYGIGSHVIPFIARGDAADIIRILHERMDSTRHE